MKKPEAKKRRLKKLMNAKLKCKGCNKYFSRDSIIKINAGRFCGIECALKYGQEKAVQAKQRQFKKAQQVKALNQRKAKERLKTNSQLVKEAQAAINKYVRERDFFDGCISCDKTKQEVESNQSWKVGGAWDAGHYKTRGARPQLRFNLWNIHKQCKSCNAGSHKNSAKSETVGQTYTQKLTKKIGSDKVDFLETYQGGARYSDDYLRRIKKIFNKKHRLLKKRRE